MRGIGAGVRVFEVIDRAPVIPYDQGDEVPRDCLGVVRFEGVVFEYPTRKDVKVLNDFNMDIGIGESVAIV